MYSVFESALNSFLPTKWNQIDDGDSDSRLVKAKVLVFLCLLVSFSFSISNLFSYLLHNDFILAEIALSLYLPALVFAFKKLAGLRSISIACFAGFFLFWESHLFTHNSTSYLIALFPVFLISFSFFYFSEKATRVAFSVIVCSLVLRVALEPMSTKNTISLVVFSLIAYTLFQNINELLAKAKQEIQENHQKYLEANNSRDMFWANMSHEIRTPLNGILGMINLIYESNIDKNQKQLVDIMKDSAEGLNIILSDIVDFSRIEADELEIIKKPFSLKEMMDEIVILFGNVTREKNIRLSYIIDSDVPFGVLSDELRVKQILINLITNAIKFTESGHIKVLIQKGTKQDSLAFSVEDSGIGIKKSKLEMIFQPFSQVDLSNSRKFGGTGLGLVICKRLSELLGGEIKVESFPGKGSTFTFSIKALSVQVKSSHHRTSKAQNRPLVPLKTKDLKILCVDDNPINLVFLVSILKKRGYEPDQATNGQEALDMIAQNSYDVVLMDVQMPVMDGIEATKIIVSKYHDKRPRIIAVTANVLQEDRDRCFEAGMDDFLSKPVNKNILFSVLDRYSKQLFSSYESKSLNTLQTQENNRKVKIEENKDQVVQTAIESAYKYFDVNQLLENFGEDFEVIKVVVGTFKDGSKERLSELEKAIFESDYKLLKETSHNLKGSFKTLFSPEGVRLSIKLEKMGKEKSSLNEAEDLYKQLCAHVEHLNSDLEVFLEQNSQEEAA